MTMSPRLERKYLLSTLVAVTGVKPVTFHAWRTRNNLFPRTQEEQGWKYYSIADICVARTVVHLTGNGSSAQFAVDASMALLPRFEELAMTDNDEPFENCFAFVAKSEAEDGEAGDIEVRMFPENAPLSQVARLSASGVLIDLLQIFGGVVDFLYELEPETVATSKDTLKLVAQTLASAIRSASEAEEDE